jgi:hypothetical protein
MKMNRRTFVRLSTISMAGLPLLQVSHGRGAPAPQPSLGVGEGKLYETFQHPSGLAKPFVRWWWNGNRIEKPELLRELDLLKAAGIGGVEINSIEFPETADPMQCQAVDWLSEPWLKMLQATVQGAKERGLVCDIIVGSGWPFGGEFLTEPEQTQLLTLGTRNLVGPKRYEISRQELLKEIEPAIASKRAQKRKELVALRLAPAQMATFQAGVDLKAQLQNETVVVEVPEGEHVLYFLVKLTGFQAVIHGAPGASGPVLNHYNQAAVEKYLNRMSDGITAKLGFMGKHFRSLFVDSLEIEGANWCDDMLLEFEKRRGYALTPYLPFILFKTGRMGRALTEDYGTKLSGQAQETIQRVRFDFESTRMELFRERFLETFLAWCRKNGVQSRVQAYGREYHPLDASLLADIPECETWLRPHTVGPMKEQDATEGRSYTQINKFVSSAAHLSGKRLVSCEELTNTQVVFNASLEWLKKIADHSNISGVTHSILHGFNYSPKDAPFPGWVRYGTFLNERNPWWPYFPRWAEYKARLSAVFQNADLYADIAVMHPLADLWSKHGVPWDPNPGLADPPYVFNVWEAIHQSGHGCDYVSESILQQASFAKGQLAYGPRKYKVLVLVEVESLQPQTAEALGRFVEADGQLVFVGKEPVRAPGLTEHEKRDKAVRDMLAAMKQKHPERVVLYPAPQPTEAMLDWFKGLQTRLGLEPYVRFDHPVSAVSQVRYSLPNTDVFFVANSSLSDSYELNAEFHLPGRTAWLWDPETGERYLYPTSGQGNQLRIHLAPAASKLIVFDNQKAQGKTYAPAPSAPQAQGIAGPWKVRLEPVDGAARSLTLEQLVDFKGVSGLKAFAGVIWYETAVQIQDPSVARYLNLGKVHGVSEVILNGRNLGTKWYGDHVYEVAGATKAGNNLLQVKVTTTLGNYMKSLKTNKDGVKWMKKQPAYSMGMVGPVTI